MMDHNGIIDALSSKKVGESVVYHVCHDIKDQIACIRDDKSNPKHAAVKSIADFVSELSDQGRVHLVQRRRLDGGLDYIVQRGVKF